VFREIEWRVVAKVISWRILLTLLNFTYTYVVTGNWRAGLAVAGIAAIVNSFIYWGHEKIWNVIEWGRVQRAQTCETGQSLPD
jgi:uncharacterized membrane protein